MDPNVKSNRRATRSASGFTLLCTPGTCASLWGGSPVREVRLSEPLAKDKGASVRVGPEEVWSKPASPRTGMPYKAGALGRVSTT